MSLENQEILSPLETKKLKLVANLAGINTQKNIEGHKAINVFMNYYRWNFAGQSNFKDLDNMKNEAKTWWSNNSKNYNLTLHEYSSQA